MGDENGNSITIDYLVDLISSIKAALHNTDSVGSQNNEILSEVSENLAILTELYKKQNQDQKVNQYKVDELIKKVSELSTKLELYNHEVVSSHDKLSSNLDIITGYKSQTIEEINTNIKKVEEDLKYLKSKRQEQEIVESLAAKRDVEDKKAMKDKQARKEEEENPTNWFQKAISFVKGLNDSVSTIYKILLLLLGVVLLILLFAGVITWQDIGHILGLKFFQ